MISGLLKEGVPVYVCEPALDGTTDAGQLVLNLLASIAQYERRLISARTREAYQVALQDPEKRLRLQFVPLVAVVVYDDVAVP